MALEQLSFVSSTTLGWYICKREMQMGQKERRRRMGEEEEEEDGRGGGCKMKCAGEWRDIHARVREELCD
jgi:hypothetical protein